EIILCGESEVGMLDYIFVREDGIFVIDICRSKGKIESDKRGGKWCVTNGNKTKEIKNPTINLRESIEVLKEVVNDKYHKLIKGIVIFTEALNIDKITIDFEGLKIIDVEEYFKLDRESVLDDKEIFSLREQISICNIRDKKIRKKRKALNCNYRIIPIVRNEKMDKVDRVKIILEMKNEVV
ncbi:MAG: nuclease-related domain-containing protein, partial [Clostridium sp.]